MFQVGCKMFWYWSVAQRSGLKNPFFLKNEKTLSNRFKFNDIMIYNDIIGSGERCVTCYSSAFCEKSLGTNSEYFGDRFGVNEGQIRSNRGTKTESFGDKFGVIFVQKGQIRSAKGTNSEYIISVTIPKRCPISDVCRANNCRNGLFAPVFSPKLAISCSEK